MKRPVLRLLTSGGIGDVIAQTAAIRGWKQQNPTGRLIVYCTAPEHRDVLRGNPHVDDLQLVTDVQRTLALLPIVQRWIKKNTVRADYGRIAPSLFHRKRAGALIGEMLGVEVELTKPEIFLTEAENCAASACLAELRVPVAIHAVPRCSDNKLWFLERWEALVEQCPQYSFVQIGLPAEPAIAGARDLRGLSLRDAFAVIGRSRAFVGVDSGPAHAAAALGTPAVVLFGPSTPEIWGHPTAWNLYERVGCAPCIDMLYSDPCPYGRACMSAISVAAVKDALRSALGEQVVGSAALRAGT